MVAKCPPGTFLLYEPRPQYSLCGRCSGLKQSSFAFGHTKRVAQCTTATSASFRSDHVGHTGVYVRTGIPTGQAIVTSFITSLSVSSTPFYFVFLNSCTVHFPFSLVYSLNVVCSLVIDSVFILSICICICRFMSLLIFVSSFKFSILSTKNRMTKRRCVRDHGRVQQLFDCRD